MSGQIGTRKLLMEIDGEEYSAESSNARFVAGAADSDFTTFKQAREGGGRQYTLAATFAQDAGQDSVWRMVFSRTGETVPVTLIPYGNPVPSATEPHYTADVTIQEPDGDFLGGEANTSKTAKMTFDIEWPLDAKFTEVTAP